MSKIPDNLTVSLSKRDDPSAGFYVEFNQVTDVWDIYVHETDEWIGVSASLSRVGDVVMTWVRNHTPPRRENAMTRDERHELRTKLAKHIHDGMSCNDIHEFVIEHLYAVYQRFTDERLLDEIEEHAPHLLDEEEEHAPHLLDEEEEDDDLEPDEEEDEDELGRSEDELGRLDWPRR